MQDMTSLEEWALSQVMRFRGGIVVEELQSELLAAGFAQPDLDAVDAVDALATELQDRVVEARTVSDPEEKVKKFSVRWYQLLADLPVVPSTPELEASGDWDKTKPTVRQMCYFLAKLHREGGMTVESVNTLCKAFHRAHLLSPALENRMPRCIFPQTGLYCCLDRS